jgi:hypothetical protein
MMEKYGKSDSSVVPEKLPNKALKGAAEVMEERGLAKGNSHKCNAPRTQSRISGSNALERVREAAGTPWRHHPKQEPYEVMPHVRIRAGGAGQPASLPRPPPFGFCEFFDTRQEFLYNPSARK